MLHLYSQITGAFQLSYHPPVLENGKRLGNSKLFKHLGDGTQLRKNTVKADV